MPEFADIEGYGEEPVAFGLVALLVQIKFPEDKSGIVDEFEEKLGKNPRRKPSASMFVRRTARLNSLTLVFTKIRSSSL